MRYLLVTALISLASVPAAAQYPHSSGFTYQEYDTIVKVDASCRADRDVLAKRVTMVACMQKKLKKLGLTNFAIYSTKPGYRVQLP